MGRRAGATAAAPTAVLLATLGVNAADPAAAGRALEPDPAHVAAAVRLMTDLQAESAVHAAAIRDAYRPAVATLALTNRTSLQAAITAGTILALPQDAAAHNVRPRLTGRHPIGEADLAHQHLYLGARPETVGLLLEIAARVASGPLEITSLARHDEYQRRLARTNANARTAVPTHVMGLAFDVSILHTSLGHAMEIRDVLQDMARDGDLHFVAERRQLVFHVVPSPSRRGHYAALARRAGERDLRPDRPQLVRATANDAPPDAIADTAAPSTGSRSPFVHYAGLFAWLVGAGLGVPPGEDLVLAGVGALVANGVLAWWPMLVLAIGGVVTSDLIMFAGGRVAAAAVARRIDLNSRARRLDAVLRRWGRAAVVVARFTPGLRALVFASAGARGMPPVSFALIDICAAIVWVPLMMALGAWGLRSLVAAAPASLEWWG